MRGVSAVQTAMGSIHQGFTRATGAVQKLASIVSLTGGGLFAGIAAGATRGTVEGERFARALEYMTRVIGDKLAPYVRMLTQGIIEVANWWKGLDSTLVENITQWAAVATGVSVVVKLLPTVGTAISALISVVVAFLNPWVTIPVVIGGAVAALLYFGATGETIGEKMQSVVEMLIKGWIYLKATIASAQAFSGAVAEDIFTKMATWAKQLGIFKTLLSEEDLKRVGSSRGPAEEARREFERVLKELKDAPEMAKKFMEGMKDWKNPFDNWLKQMEKAWERIKKAGKGGGFSIRVDVGLESFQNTWDRLQKAFADPAKLDEARVTIEELKKANGSLEKMILDGIKVKDLPAPVQ